MSFHVDVIPNKRGRDSILFRQSWREGNRVRKKTIANLTDLSPVVIDGIKAVVGGGVAFPSIDRAVSIRRSLPHGHVAAILGTCHNLGLQRILHRNRSRERDLALAAIVARVIRPDSKLATARRLSPQSADSSAGISLNLGRVGGNEMLDMLDWLVQRKRWIEDSLARRHMRDATLLLYDVTSSYLEGRSCSLRAFGYNRDKKAGKMQIVFGLLCSPDGCPIGVEVFSGNTSDPNVLKQHISRIESRFDLKRIALVGDRGMITNARIRENLKPAELSWISALRATSLRKLVRPRHTGEPDLVIEDLEEDAVAEIISPDFPGERLMVCLNPRLREERRRKREALLSVTGGELDKVVESVRTGRLSGKARIGARVGGVINRRKVAKHFDVTISDSDLSWKYHKRNIDAEAQFDGVYIIRTNLRGIEAEAAVGAYKSLSLVETAFRSIKDHLRVRPIFVYTSDHVRGHVLLCMLAYYVEWHMRKRLAPLLFEDDDRPGARMKRNGPVSKAGVSDRAKRKAGKKQNEDGFTVHSFGTLLDDLGTLTVNEVGLPGSMNATVCMLAKSTPLQKRVFELLEVNPNKNVPSAMTGSND